MAAYATRYYQALFTLQGTTLDTSEVWRMQNTIQELKANYSVGTIYKLLAKLMANQLQPSLDTLIWPNQTGFLKSRNIINNIFLAFKAMDWAEESK
uniref:Reverse transcriptase domain-containing protein n=1 Tax=Physcomitrium patens TaxID=3218 RepID=A0A2K1JUP1_PHYPA|nr:hypothetical protein PHYPA_015011 [Physcomitrium patens]